MHKTVVVVGGGVVGTWHALEAHRRGMTVIHLEADAEPRGATTRNHGLVWLTGCAVGDHLELALRSRARWEQVARSTGSVVLRADGSLTVLYNDAELEVAEQAVQRDDRRRGLRVVTADEARRINPALAGEFLGAVHCAVDALVEPREVLRRLRSAVDGDRYHWHPGRIAVDVEAGRVVDCHGEVHRGDGVVLCVGARREGVAAALAGDAPVRRVRQQLFQTQPYGQHIRTAVSDGLSLYYYPSYDVPARVQLPDKDPVDQELGLKLTLSQRTDGCLTIGGSHLYEEPFDFASSEDVYQRISDRAERVLGNPLPPIARRWSGTYATTFDGRGYVRSEPLPGVMLVTGVALGMTIAPAIAEATFDAMLLT